MKATSFSSSISANLGNSGEAMVSTQSSTLAILSRDRTEDDEIFCTALPIIYGEIRW